MRFLSLHPQSQNNKEWEHLFDEQYAKGCAFKFSALALARDFIFIFVALISPYTQTRAR